MIVKINITEEKQRVLLNCLFFKQFSLYSNRGILVDDSVENIERIHSTCMTTIITLFINICLNSLCSVRLRGRYFKHVLFFSFKNIDSRLSTPRRKSKPDVGRDKRV